jgi:uncharacterized membrane protein
MEPPGEGVGPGDRSGEDDESGSAFGRILALSDGVFAIAMTLLVLEFVLPRPGTGGDLGRILLRQWPKGFAYLLSFAIIGRFWAAHHQGFRHIARFNGRLVWLNLLLLFFVAFLPYPTEVLGTFGGRPIAAVFYAASVAAASSASAAVWWYASGPGHLLRPGTDPGHLRLARARTFSAPVFFVLTIPIAVVSAYTAEAIWAIGFPALRLAISLRHHRR